MFFGTLISTHLLYRKLYPTGFTDAEGHQRFIQNLFNIELTSFSTFILLMSSFLMALAVSAMHKGQIKSFRRNVLGVIFFGLIFLGCQVYEFTHFFHQGLTIQNSVFGSTFYVLTGTHGTHVAIGILWLILLYFYSFTGSLVVTWVHSMWKSPDFTGTSWTSFGLSSLPLSTSLNISGHQASGVLDFP
jgi:heme/copper-type cytochrome/quinol oxidase subunit 3